jgi:crossover junction endodeoxyribonuclease RuvC
MIPRDLVPRDCPWPIVLGVDPGTRVLGWGALVLAGDAPRLVACGVLRAPREGSVSARLAHLQAELDLLLARLRPRFLALEGAFSARNVRSALRLGEARGVVLAAAARLGIDVAEIAPAVAKKAVLGHGHGTKAQVARLVATILAREKLDVPADATDALAIALAHANRLRSGALAARSGPARAPAGHSAFAAALAEGRRRASNVLRT